MMDAMQEIEIEMKDSVDVYLDRLRVWRVVERGARTREVVSRQ